MKASHEWFKISNEDKIVSPSLLVYPDRIEQNIRMMIKMAGGAERLRPHIKTHKMAEIIQMQMAHGITKFKCATIAEAELLAKSGATDILLAKQPAGADVYRYFDLMDRFPDSGFSTIVDNQKSIELISGPAKVKEVVVDLWLDINSGMGRTGVQPGKLAKSLFEKIVKDSSLKPRGLHVYDGHIHETDFAKREERCNREFVSVQELKDDLSVSGIAVEMIVAGGTPTFPIHIKRESVEVSPGTPLLWDQGYSDLFPDMDFLPAAVLMTRVISKPANNLVCFDLGHKSVASEMNLPRVKFFTQGIGKHLSQSEEHLVVEVDVAVDINVGDVFYTLPVHVCPTVAKYSHVKVVMNGEVKDAWSVAARDHESLLKN